MDSEGDVIMQEVTTVTPVIIPDDTSDGEEEWIDLWNNRRLRYQNHLHRNRTRMGSTHIVAGTQTGICFHVSYRGELA